jgi:uncharacterized membrane protein YcaP (DUF421 family)
MSDTPETQKAVMESNGQWSFVLKECCERLERERDEAREALASREVVIAQQNVITDLLLERDEARDKYATEATEHMLAINKLCNERDEARDVLQAVIKTGKRLEHERDEAREHLKLSVVWQSLRDSQDEVLRLTFENRELRNLINE